MNWLVALCCFLVFSSTALARPGHTKKQPRVAAPKSVAERTVLVKRGKLPGFFFPEDLSKPPVLSAPSVCLIDFDTGELLYESGADQRRFPASTTKILTGLLLVESVSPETVITATNPKLKEIEPSSLHIQTGEKFRAEELLRGFLLRSANDGSVVIAEHIAGSVKAFAEKMNARAIELGATASHFNNPHGLPDKNHYTTARDLALIARAAMQNPRFADAVSVPDRVIERSINVKDVKVQSKAKAGFYAKFPGADGIKTGFTNAARHCFVGSATRGGRRLIAVVLGAPSNAVGDTVALLDWGFRRFGSERATLKDQPGPSVAIREGNTVRVSTMATQTVHVPIDSLRPEVVSKRVVGAAPLAPIQKGQTVGELEVRLGDRVVSRVPLVAATDVPHSAISAAAQSPLPYVCFGVGGVALALIGYRHGIAPLSSSSKGTRRRRRRIPAQGRDADYRRSRDGGRRGSDDARNGG